MNEQNKLYVVLLHLLHNYSQNTNMMISYLTHQLINFVGLKFHIALQITLYWDSVAQDVGSQIS